MKLIIFLTVFVFYSQEVLSKKEAVNTVVLYSTQDNSQQCAKPGLQCEDCETIRFCSDDLQTLFSMKCQDQNKLRPYCDAQTNSCVTDLPVICKPGVTAYTCPGVGKYPDLENCKNYYECNEDKRGINVKCPTGHIYDHQTQSCIKKLLCKSYSSGLGGLCRSKVNKLIAYAPSKNLYILCLSGKPSLLFECPHNGEVFDETEVRCKFECTKNGYFPNPYDATKFYACISNGKTFIQQILQCPEGYEFLKLGDGTGVCAAVTPAPPTTTEPVTSDDNGDETPAVTPNDNNTDPDGSEPPVENDDETLTSEKIDGQTAPPEESNPSEITDAPTENKDLQGSGPSETSENNENQNHNNQNEGGNTDNGNQNPNNQNEGGNTNNGNQNHNNQNGAENTQNNEPLPYIFSLLLDDKSKEDTVSIDSNESN